MYMSFLNQIWLYNKIGWMSCHKDYQTSHRLSKYCVELILCNYLWDSCSSSIRRIWHKMHGISSVYLQQIVTCQACQVNSSCKLCNNKFDILIKSVLLMLSNAYSADLVSGMRDLPMTKSAKYGSCSISGSGVMKNHLHIWHACIWTHIYGVYKIFKFCKVNRR